MVGWWSSYQRGVRSSKLQKKILSVWTSERCICDPKSIHLYDSMTRRLKPSKHICSTWLTDSTIDKHDTCDWSLVDRDDDCVTLNVTLCVILVDVFIVNTSCTQEVKTLSMTRTWSQAWYWHQHETIWMRWTSKVDENTHTSSWSELECVQSSSETLKGGSETGCRPEFWRVAVATTTRSWGHITVTFLIGLWLCNRGRRYNIHKNSLCFHKYFFFFLDIENRNFLNTLSGPRTFILFLFILFITTSCRSTPSANSNSRFVGPPFRNHPLNILCQFFIPFFLHLHHNYMKFFNYMIKGFTVLTCRCGILAVSYKITSLARVIANDMSTSSINFTTLISSLVTSMSITLYIVLMFVILCLLSISVTTTLHH